MPTNVQLQPGDFFLSEQEKSVRALQEFTVSTIDSIHEPAFDAAYKLLDAEFGVRGELERREVLEGWLARRSGLLSGDINIQYFIVIVRDREGNIAGIRDCYVTNDPKHPERCVVYLAHVLVLPAYRRSGVASLLRASPAVLARQESAKYTDKPLEILLAGEMEPLSLEHEDTLVRLIAYGKSGFWAIDPAYLPYCQPDFRDLAALQVPPQPIPLLAVVRFVGQESNPNAPVWSAKAFVERLYGVFAASCREEDLRPALTHSLQSVARISGETFALLPLPRNAQDEGRMRPLLRDRVLSFFPRTLFSQG
jgi:GNAT superfamily N-acetyltransferase